MAPRFEAGEQKAHLALLGFVLVFLFRYLRTFVSIWTFVTYPIMPIRSDPKYRSYRDVTVVVPTTFNFPDELVKCLRNIIACRPYDVFIVTSNANLPALQSFCDDQGFTKSVRCLAVRKLNKRKQILEALQHVQTEIVAFADDDVFWPTPSFLDYVLALFEDPKVGAGGPRQRVRRSGNINGWWFLGCAYLERRVWNNLSTQAIDGSISTLSGRTALYRTEILRCDEFYHYFQTDSWLGKKLNSDDDKCLTRYVYSHGHSIKIQGDERATIETTFEEGSKFLSQCLRWARAHFRGNFTVMTNNTYWRSPQYFWGFYVIYVTQFFQFALISDALLMALLIRGLGRPVSESTFEIAVFAIWILCSKLLKLMPHFILHPEDMKFIPLSIAFSYLHTFINLWSLITLHQTHWGSQKISGEDEQDEYITLRPHSAIDEMKEEEEHGDVLVELIDEAMVCETSNDRK